MTLLFQLVFNKLGGMSTDGIPPFLFYFVNNTVWAFFAATFGSISSVFTSGKTLMSKVYFPRIIPPIALLCVGFVSFAVQLSLLIVVLPIIHFSGGIFHLQWSVLFIGVPVLQTAMIAAGLGFCLACLTLKYRDLTALSGVIVQGMMYLSPVIFPFALIPSKFQLLASFNPLASSFELLRFFVFGEGTLSVQLLAIGWGVTLVVFIVGLVSFNVVQRKFVDIV